MCGDIATMATSINHPSGDQMYWKSLESENGPGSPGVDQFPVLSIARGVLGFSIALFTNAEG